MTIEHKPITNFPTALDTQLFESSPDCVKILDRQGRVTAMNQNGQCVMEIDDFATIAGKPWTALWPEASHVELDQAFATALNGKVGRFNAFCPTIKGTPKWWDVMVTPVRSSDGQIESLFSVSRDVTAMHQAAMERERLMRELQAASDRMSDIFRQAPAFICVMHGPEHVFEMVNEYYLQLVGNRNPVGQPIRQALPEVEGQGFFELLDQVFLTGEPYKGSGLPVLLQRTPHTALEKRFVDFVYMALKDAEGVVTGIMAHGVDQTERKIAEEKLQESSQRKDHFLAMLAHELRNPLAPIGAAAKLLQLGRSDQAQVRRASEIIGRQVGHMTHLIDDLLDVSRVTRGLVELDLAPLEVRHAAIEAVEQVNPLIHSRQHQLALHLTADTALVLGDKKRLVQVIANILTNAAKYTHEGGQIELRTFIQDAQMIIEVTDNGIGMTPELVTHAFDLFEQAERTSDRSSGGLGLGLALVKSLVELHNGAVTCTSEGLGKGSRFTVCLPVVVAESENDSCQRSNAIEQGEVTKPLRIMIVDDNADAAAMLAMLLETAGHDVVIEHGSSRALERAKLAAPQVCLLDIGLPEIDGYELAQRLRAQQETASVILIAVTGYGQEDDRMRSTAAGFDHHFVKPVDTSKLEAVLFQISETLTLCNKRPDRVANL